MAGSSKKNTVNNLQSPIAISKYIVFDKKHPDLGIIAPDCLKKLIELLGS